MQIEVVQNETQKVSVTVCCKENDQFDLMAMEQNEWRKQEAGWRTT